MYSKLFFFWLLSKSFDCHHNIILPIALLYQVFLHSDLLDIPLLHPAIFFSGFARVALSLEISIQMFSLNHRSHFYQLLKFSILFPWLFSWVCINIRPQIFLQTLFTKYGWFQVYKINAEHCHWMKLRQLSRR